jgi:cysteinyl-tRNA synthetase
MSAFDRHIDADLNTAGALSVVWETMKDRDASPADIRATILQFDTILGLGLTHEDARAQELYRKESGELVKDVPEDIQALLTQRDRARAEKRFEDADKLRASIEKKGYAVVDSKDGARVVSHA